MFGICCEFQCITLCPFFFCNHQDKSWFLCLNCISTVLLLLLLCIFSSRLQCVTVVFPDHTHFLFCKYRRSIKPGFVGFVVDLLRHTLFSPQIQDIHESNSKINES